MNFPRTTIFDEHYRNFNVVSQLTGVTMGVLGAATFVSPVYMHRYHDQAITWDEICTIDSDFDPKTRLIDMHNKDSIDPIAQSLLKNRVGNQLLLFER